MVVRSPASVALPPTPTSSTTTTIHTRFCQSFGPGIPLAAEGLSPITARSLRHGFGQAIAATLVVSVAVAVVNVNVSVSVSLVAGSPFGARCVRQSIPETLYAPSQARNGGRLVS